jgi:hypothetical protein
MVCFFYFRKSFFLIISDSDPMPPANARWLLTFMRLLHSLPAPGDINCSSDWIRTRRCRSFEMTGRRSDQGRGQKGRKQNCLSITITLGLSALSLSSPSAPVIAKERPVKVVGRRKRLKQSHARQEPNQPGEEAWIAVQIKPLR